MENALEIVSYRARRYEAIPIVKIKVINSRSRDQEQFDMNVESINQVGLLKPIRVNDKFLERTEMYELICGEGRLQAHQRLGHAMIQAEVVTCTRKEAYLQSLIENIARTKPDSMDFAREIKRLHDEGWDYEKLAQIGSGGPPSLRKKKANSKTKRIERNTVTPAQGHGFNFISNAVVFILPTMR